MKFKIDDAALRRIFSAWNLPLPSQDLVLFAFRGCIPARNSGGWSSFAALQTQPLDYRHLRCTLGIWNRKTARVFAAPGSTVPHRDNVLKAAARKGNLGGKGTNQPEPGYYEDLKKGEHLQGKPMGHAALRQTGYRFYRRAAHAPPYTRRDPLFFGNPYDNLHCAWNLGGKEPGFRSSGCLVVAGMPHCPRLPDSDANLGAWKTFHDLIYAAPQKKSFPFLLLSAVAVTKFLGEKKPALRLCYGSQGPWVEKLQRELKRKKLYRGPADGKLGTATYRAWNRAGLSGYGELM